MQPAPIPLRQQVIRKAQEILNLQPVVLDTETTGLGNYDEIIEIALVDHEGKVIYESLVRPTIEIPPDSTRINRITNEMVKTAPSWQEVWNQVQPLIYRKRVVIYNAEFDVRLMQQTHRIARIAWSNSFTPVCLMKLFAAYLGEWNSYKQDFRFVTLEKAGALSGIKLPNSHRAADDTLLAYALLKHLASLNEAE
jgi:DNA polymerase-3 subunit epsilon